MEGLCIAVGLAPNVQYDTIMMSSSLNFIGSSAHIAE
jgi:hypothetical protein